MAIIFPDSRISNMGSETWRIQSSFSGDNNFMGANSMTTWARSNDVGGTSPYDNGNTNLLSESSGVFTFNELGAYLINFQCTFYHSQQTRYHQMAVYYSWNNGANWDVHAYAYGAFPDANSGYSGTQYHTAHGSCHLVIPSNSGNGCRKLRFGIATYNNSTNTYGGTSETFTGFTATKVSDHIHQ